MHDRIKDVLQAISSLDGAKARYVFIGNSIYICSEEPMPDVGVLLDPEKPKPRMASIYVLY